MQVNNISITRVKNLGNYESLRLELSVTPTKDVSETIADMSTYIDWWLNKDSRTAQFEKFSKQLETASGDKADELQSWIDKYNELESKIAAISFELPEPNVE
jgi:oligoendopeptidase F